jgi:serine/threonine protein kinase
MNKDNSSKQAIDIPEGSAVDQYRIVEKIGEGGMGSVYKAEDTVLKRPVALKFLSPAYSQEHEHRERFLREARAAARLSHPNIVSVHGVGEYNDLPYCAMAFIEGRTLIQPGGGVLLFGKIIDYGIQIADGIAAAHEKGITHRDLKPANILIDRNDTINIVDFGLAVFSEPENRDDTETTLTRLTTDSAFAGTIGYMAPEQLQGGESGPHVDIFALGVVLYELTCGVHPFAGASPAETAARILRDEPAAITEHRSDAPYDLMRIIGRCMRKDKSRRFQTARDIRNELLDLKESALIGSVDQNPASTNGENDRLPQEKRFVLTAEAVRKLKTKSPRMVGDRMLYLDNEVSSDMLVVYLHPWGVSHRHTEEFLAKLPYRSIAPTLYGFDHSSPNRLPLTLEDHSSLMRELFSQIHASIKPKYTMLTGFSSGADHALHMVTSETGPGIPVDVLLSFGCNTSFDSCFLSSKFSDLEGSIQEGLLDDIKKIGGSTETISEWLKFHEYMVDIFSKFGENADPLRIFGKSIVEPFEKNDWRQFASWYRSVMERIPHVRFVIDSDDMDKIDEILERHLDSNVLGDNFREDTIVRENISHIELSRADIMQHHINEMAEKLLK